MKNLQTFSEFVNESLNEKMKPITKKHWDKADDDQREEWLLQVIKDPDDADQYIEMDWEDIPPDMTRSMYENVIVAQTLNEGLIKKKVISIIEYTGNMWKDRAKDMGVREKDIAEEMANDMSIIKGSMKWTDDLFLVNGYTEAGLPVYVKQEGEFNKYGGPYEPKMYKWIVEIKHRWMEDAVMQAYKAYGWDFTSGNKLDITRTDIWGHIVKEFKP